MTTVSATLKSLRSVSAESAPVTVIPSERSMRSSTAGTSTRPPPPRRPRAILHVGPHKTGSTSFQKFCYGNKPVLLQDNFLLPQLDAVFKREKTVANLGFCLQTQNLDPPCDQIVGNATRFLEQARQQNKSVLISTEEFSKASVDLDRLEALVAGFDVEVVVVYRRFYEYLPSIYFETFKHSQTTYQEKGTEGLLKRPTFAEWLTPEIGPRFRRQHTSDVLERYQRLGPVQVYNWYAPGDFLSNFVCSLNLTNACREAQNIQPAASNAGYSFDSEIILAEAHRRHLVDWGELVQQNNYTIILGQLNEFLTEHRKHGNGAEYICLSETQERDLLRLSIEIEEAILPSIGSSNLEDIDEDFRKQDGAFCSLNVTDFFNRHKAPLGDLLRSIA